MTQAVRLWLGDRPEDGREEPWARTPGDRPRIWPYPDSPVQPPDGYQWPEEAPGADFSPAAVWGPAGRPAGGREMPFGAAMLQLDLEWIQEPGLYPADAEECEELLAGLYRLRAGRTHGVFGELVHPARFRNFNGLAGPVLGLPDGEPDLPCVYADLRGSRHIKGFVSARRAAMRDLPAGVPAFGPASAEARLSRPDRPFVFGGGAEMDPDADWLWDVRPFARDLRELADVISAGSGGLPIMQEAYWRERAAENGIEWEDDWRLYMERKGPRGGGYGEPMRWDEARAEELADMADNSEALIWEAEREGRNAEELKAELERIRGEERKAARRLAAERTVEGWEKKALRARRELNSARKAEALSAGDGRAASWRAAARAEERLAEALTMLNGARLAEQERLTEALEALSEARAAEQERLKAALTMLSEARMAEARVNEGKQRSNAG